MNRWLILGLISIVLLLLLLPAKRRITEHLTTKSNLETQPDLEDFELNNDKFDASFKGIEEHLVHRMKCSKDCCGAQWPVPHMMQTGGSCADKDYVPSNITCGNGPEGTGCVCMPRASYDFLGDRGGNNQS
jgi:hypothetical protein